MSNNRKKILIIILVFILIVLFVIAFFLFKPREKVYDIKFNFKNIDEVNVDIDVKSDKFVFADIMVSVDDKVDISNLLKIDDSMFDLNKIGTYKIIYYVIYKDKRYETEQIVNVIDRETPVIKLNGGDITILVNEKYNEPGYEVTDNYDIDLKDKVVIDNQVDNSKAGTYKIIYKVSDSSNNTSEVVRNVTVKKPNKVVAPKEEIKVVIPKVVETAYSNTIKKNKFTASSIILEGYLKDVKEENKIKLIGEETFEFKTSVKDNNYKLILDISNIPNGIYKMYINDEELLNKMAEIERLARAKVGSKLVTFLYSKDEVSIKIENHAYLYDIIINPGHGADDTGATNEYITEKEMNLNVSMYEKCRYEAHGLKVYITRTNNDTYSKNFGPSSAIRLHKLAYEMGYYGAVSKVVYSNHHNFIVNNYYMGYEVLVAGSLTKEQLKDEIAIASKWDNIYKITENHLRFYARNYDTDGKYAKLDGQTYTFKDNYAVNRIPLNVSNVKATIYEGCYMSNKDDFKWYWLDNNWYKVSEAKIEVYVKSLGLNYNSDNSSCM